MLVGITTAQQEGSISRTMKNSGYFKIFKPMKEEREKIDFFRKKTEYFFSFLSERNSKHSFMILE